jgi:hypothetical protein
VTRGKSVTTDAIEGNQRHRFLQISIDLKIIRKSKYPENQPHAADHLQTVNTDAVEINQIHKNLQISTDLNTNRNSKRVMQISTNLKNG